MALAGTAAVANTPTKVYEVDWMGVQGSIFAQEGGAIAVCSPLTDMAWHDHYSVHNISNFASDWETLQDIADDTAAASHSINYYINNDRVDDIYSSLVVRLCYGQNVMQAVMSGEQFIDFENLVDYIEFIDSQGVTTPQDLSIAQQITLTTGLQEWVAEDMDEYWFNNEITFDYDSVSGDTSMFNAIANHMNGTNPTLLSEDFPYSEADWNQDNETLMSFTEAICVWELNDSFGQIQKHTGWVGTPYTDFEGNMVTFTVPSAVAQAATLDPWEFEADILDYGDWGNCIN